MSASSFLFLEAILLEGCLKGGNCYGATLILQERVREQIFGAYSRGSRYSPTSAGLLWLSEDAVRKLVEVFQTDLAMRACYRQRQTERLFEIDQLVQARDKEMQLCIHHELLREEMDRIAQLSLLESGARRAAPPPSNEWAAPPPSNEWAASATHEQQVQETPAATHQPPEQAPAAQQTCQRRSKIRIPNPLPDYWSPRPGYFWRVSIQPPSNVLVNYVTYLPVADPYTLIGEEVPDAPYAVGKNAFYGREGDVLKIIIHRSNSIQCFVHNV